MKQKEALIITGMVISAVFLYVGMHWAMDYSQNGKHDEDRFIEAIKTGHEGELLPNINVLLSDSVTNLNIASIPAGRPIVLFYFGPNCPFCELEIKEIISNIRRVRDIDFYLLTPYSYGEMRKFYEKFNIRRYDNITVGVDYGFKFGEYFKTQTVPYLAIYNNRRKLNEAFLGNVKIDQILSVSQK